MLKNEIRETEGQIVELSERRKRILRTVVESYIALYRIETENVSVGRIINARQDYIRILLGEVTPCHSP